jgi:hypothetical protein
MEDIGGRFNLMDGGGFITAKLWGDFPAKRLYGLDVGYLVGLKLEAR